MEGSADRMVFRWEAAGPGRPRASWHLARRRRVLVGGDEEPVEEEGPGVVGEEEEVWRVKAAVQSFSADWYFLRDM